MRNSLFYGTSKICFPRKLKRDRYGRIVFDSSVSGLAPGIVKQLERKYDPSDESGRSILEIMAVIALITLISVGTIKGYDAAQQKAKAQNESKMIAMLIKERQIRALSPSGNKASVQKIKIGDKEVAVENGTKGDKAPFFWIDIPLNDKVECEHLVYSDLLEPTLVTVNNEVGGECPGDVRMYFPKDPNDKDSTLATYVRSIDGKTYLCPEGAICTNHGGGFSSSFSCPEGQVQNEDETGCIPESTPGEKCSGHGTWANGGCTCEGPYYGNSCELYHDCGAHGTWSGAACSCDGGWCGTYCDEHHCNGRGAWCGTQCSCALPWTGTYCESPVVCSEHTVGPWSETAGCVCEPSWGGKDCSERCGGGFCNGNGTLDWAGANRWSEYPNLCLCDDWYGGGDCLHDFYESVYTPHGRRLGIDGVGAYVCDVGYFGALCEKTSSSVCSGNGHYIVIRERGMGCLCNDGTIQDGDPINGNLCATGDDPCNGHGTLDWAGANHWPAYPNSCLCEAGYVRDPRGAQCVANTLSSDTHGQGFGMMEGGYLCHAGYFGSNCQDQGNSVCNNNGQYIAIDGNGVGCLCNDGTIQDGDPINSNLCATGDDPCNGHGTLDWAGANHWPDLNLCLCDADYLSDGEDNQCTILGSISHGRYVGGCGWLCEPGYYDRWCDKQASSVCSNSGKFLSVANSFCGCLCDDGTFQEGDPKTLCATGDALCSNHGILNWSGAHYWPQYESSFPDGECLCDKGYYGAEYEGQCLEISNYDLCSHHGQWAGLGCLCDRGYCGMNCENTASESKICNGYGRYLSRHDGTGPYCLLDNNTIQEVSDVVCNGHGDWCGSQCHCHDGYNGPYCENEPCNGNGTWDGNSCACNAGFFGDAYTCYPCSYSEGIYLANSGECSVCDNTDYPRIITRPNRCDPICNKAGYLIDRHGSCRSCFDEVEEIYPQSDDECDRCSNRIMDGLRCNLIKSQCSEGRFWADYHGWSCQLCSDQNRRWKSTTTECASCAQSGYPRKMNSSGLCEFDSTKYNCSGHGSRKNNKCVCNTGWYGDYCEFEIPECPGHSTFTDGVCVCDEGYRGANCDEACPGGYKGVGCEEKVQCSADSVWTEEGCLCNCSKGKYATGIGLVKNANGEWITIQPGNCGCECKDCSSPEAEMYYSNDFVTDCSACNDTSYPRQIMTFRYDIKYCALKNCGTGRFRETENGGCVECSELYSAESNSTECGKCTNTSTPREMYKNSNLCVRKNCGTGYFRSGYSLYSSAGVCYSCSEEMSIVVDSSTDCTAACSNRETFTFYDSNIGQTLLYCKKK